MKLTFRLLAGTWLCLLVYLAFGSALGRIFSSTADKSPSTVSQSTWSGATNAFTNPLYVIADDDNRATVDATSRTYKLYCTDFGFDNDLDSNDEIDGIRVTFNGYEWPDTYPAGQTPVYGGYVHLLDQTGAEVALKGIVSSPFLPANHPPADGQRNLGGATDLWGMSSGYWDGIVTQPGFGFDLWFHYTNVDSIINIDSVTMRIWYTVVPTGEKRWVERTGKVFRR